MNQRTQQSLAKAGCDGNPKPELTARLFWRYPEPQDSDDVAVTQTRESRAICDTMQLLKSLTIDWLVFVVK